MNILLWILQILLALHTAIGALWKFSNSSQTVPVLQVIPRGIWLTMSGFELLCSLCLILPIFNKGFTKFVPIAAMIIAIEMLFFSSLYIYSSDRNYGQLIYWLVVAALCIFIAHSRFKLKHND